MEILQDQRFLLASSGTAFGLYFLTKFILNKLHPKKKHTKPVSHHSPLQEFTQSEVSDGDSSSGYLTAAGEDVSDLPSLAIPRLVASPLHERSMRAFKSLRGFTLLSLF